MEKIMRTRERRTPSFMPWLLCAVAVVPSICARAETISTSGRGEAPVAIAKQKKEQAALNQQALQKAEQAALAEALRQAVLRVAADPSVATSKMEHILPEALDHSATFIQDEQNTADQIQGGTAVAEVLVHVDAAALRTFLQDNFGMGNGDEVSSPFKVFVLSYTVEKMDADRSKPLITHKEIEENQQGVHASSSANSFSDSSHTTDSAAVHAAEAASSRGDASAKANASIQTPSGSAHAGTALTANWDNSQSASLDASRHRSESSSSSSAASAKAFDDTSHYYHMVVDYSDPSKPAAGATNAVRSKLAGMLTNAGFDVHTIDVSLMDQSYAGEDDIVHAALQKIRSNTEVSPDDYVAIALNSFTAVAAASHQHTAAVTYQMIRVKDGRALLPAEDIVGDSGPRPVSDDQGKNWALQAALMDVDARLPGEIRSAMQKLVRDQKRDAAQAATQYMITVENAASPKAAVSIERALAAAGFDVDRSFNGASKTLSLKVALKGKTSKEVVRAIDAASDSFEFLDQTNELTRLRVK